MTENGTKEIITDTRTLVVRSFAQAGPWALLALLLVSAGMWEAHYFVSSYVRTTATHIHNTNDALEQLLMVTNQHIQQTNDALETISKSEAQVVETLEVANATMSSALVERKQQTQILQDLLKATQKQEP